MPKKMVGASVNLGKQDALPVGPYLALRRETLCIEWAAIDYRTLPVPVELAPLGHQKIGDHWYTVYPVATAG